MNSQEDVRYTQLLAWLESELAEVFTVSVASADASFRRYFRVHLPDRTLIAMDAPPEYESLSPFKEIAADWFDAEIATPQTFAENVEQGYLLLEDFGVETMLERVSTVSSKQVSTIYAGALTQLVGIHLLPQAGQRFCLPEYSRAKLGEECELFREWFLGVHCARTLSKNENDGFDALVQTLIDSAKEQRQVPVHRDYHSRNLMYRSNEKLGVIDFQDAMFGPLYYDAVSLLKDCYYTLDPEQRDRLFFDYFSALEKHKLVEEGIGSARLAFDLMGVQRHLKAIGIFCRLHHRDGKGTYLRDIPRTAGYILELESQYPQLQSLCKVLRDSLLEKF